MRDARDYEWRRPHSSHDAGHAKNTEQTSCRASRCISSSSSSREECPYNACGNRVCRQRLHHDATLYLHRGIRHAAIASSRSIATTYCSREPKYII
ncbi:unnamed protein product [Trichogramma brassicae]|uniref:Uncharacterized protein n=1 Tax=Trichogramma brassicae TaxID=86971 RepID=A0A6H5HS36_9HYME|nr:unnamed protein product [Trichogramma brassicae]